MFLCVCVHTHTDTHTHTIVLKMHLNSEQPLTLFGILCAILRKNITELKIDISRTS